MTVDRTRSNPSDPDAPSAHDRAFAERIGRAFAPPLPSEARRLAFDRALYARLEHRRTPLWARPGLAAAAAAVLVAFVWAASFRTPTESTAELGPEEARAAAEWESDLFDPDSFEAGDELGDFDDLPPEYAAIDGLLLGG